MLDNEIHVGRDYQHSVYGKVRVLGDLTHEWEYWSIQGKKVWRVQQYGTNRTMLAISCEYFDSELI